MTGALALAVAALVAGAGDEVAAPADPGAGSAPPGAAGPPLRFALLAEGSASLASVLGADAAAGARATVRLGPLAAGLGVDVPVAFPRADAEPRALVLLGAGAALDLSPRAGWHAGVLVGSQRIVLRSYVDGDWREVLAPAGGVRAGVEWRFADARPRGPGQLGLVPLVGISATVLYVRTGADRLRGAEWGGLTALATVTLGLEASNRGSVREGG